MQGAAKTVRYLQCDFPVIAIHFTLAFSYAVSNNINKLNLSVYILTATSQRPIVTRTGKNRSDSISPIFATTA